jgi:DNA-binding MarR family transcriptional regulator
LGTSSGDDAKQAHITLGLLDAVERDGAQSQRRLAAELGIALGLVNAYLKRCVKKGLVKVSQAPAQRYAYYLTPQGFAEKSRLTVEYLSFSFSFFRRAKEECAALIEGAQARGFDRVALIGRSDLAEIATICALEFGVNIVAMVDPASNPGDSFCGLPTVRRLGEVDPPPSAVIVTDLLRPYESSKEAIAVVGEDRVLIPQLLRTQLHDLKEIAP